MCIQKIPFWLNLPRKMDEFCNFCAFLKNTILTQKITLKSRFFNKNFTTREILNIKNLKRVRFWNKIFNTCQILKQKFYNMSGFEMKILKRVRFCEKNNFFEVSPKCTTYIFHNVLLHKTMYSYSLQYLR